MQLVRPGLNTLRATSPRSSVGGPPTTSAVSRPHGKNSPAFTPMQRRFSPAWKTAKLRVLLSLSEMVRRPSASRASGAGFGTANSAEASGCGGSHVLRRYRHIVWGISAMRSYRGSSALGMQSQRYASYFRKPRQSAFRPWRSPLIQTTSRHSASSKRMEASWSSTSSNRSSSAASLACAFASRSHDDAKPIAAANPATWSMLRRDSHLCFKWLGGLSLSR